MDIDNQLSQHRTSFSTLAVDGLFIGIAGGILMALYLLLVGLLNGQTPGATLRQLGTVMTAPPIVGAFTHLSISAIYGLIFGVLAVPPLSRVFTLRIFIWLGGAVYGLLLMLIAYYRVIPGSAALTSLYSLPHLVIAHFIYGFCLGGLFSSRVLSREY